MSRPLVAVVFATLNHARTLPALLRVLDQTQWPDLRLIAVECGSTDGSLPLLEQRAARQDGPPLQLLRADGLGRASALNLALAAAGDRDVVRVHADVVPDAPDWLERLWLVLQQHPECGIVGGKLTSPVGRIQSCGRRLIGGLGIRPDWSDLRALEADRDEAPLASEVDGVHGGLCWLRATMLAATGPFDPGFDPVFGDDDDLCLRARVCGFTVFVERSVRGVHYAPQPAPYSPDFLSEPTGLWQRCQQERTKLRSHYREYWQRKWGFDPQAPDLHRIRRRYGHTRLCWQIGERLLAALPREPAVDVCFVTCNSRAVLPRMLDHLAATVWRELRVFVTDNGSTDGTVEYLRARAASLPFPMDVLAMPQNLGVAQALNLAITRGHAPIVARLDDDSFVPADWLRRLVPNFHQRPYAGVVGPRLLQANAGEGLQNGPSRNWPAPFDGAGPGDRERVCGKARVHALCGCCNVYRRAVFDVVGLLDVRFSPTQYDESDHHAALHAAGYEAIYDGSVTVLHQKSTGRGETAAAVGNLIGNRYKHESKWGGQHWQAIDRAIDLSVDGRFLPADGDTSALWTNEPTHLGPPPPLPRDPDEQRQALVMARRHSLLRTPSSPLHAWWHNQIALTAQFMRSGDGSADGLVQRLRNQLPHEPAALRVIADALWQAGDHEQATCVRARARLLDADASAAPVTEPTAPIPRGAAAGPADVVLMLPMNDDGDVIAAAVQATAAALSAVGVRWRCERNLVPEVGDARVVHAFGDEPSTLVGRLQVLRARRSPPRIVLSPLQVDRAGADWLLAAFHSHFFADAKVLRQLHGSAAAQPMASRRLDDSGLDPTRRAYWSRIVGLCDAVVVGAAAEADWLRQLAPTPPAIAVAPGLLPVAAPTAARTGDVLLLGPRGAGDHALALALATADSGLVVRWHGRQGWPFGDWQLQKLAGRCLELHAELPTDQWARALAAHRVLAWLPAAPASLLLPLQAAAAGCELIVAQGLGAETVLGRHATYVDPCDVPALRQALQAAVARSQPGSLPARRTTMLRPHEPINHGEALLAAYGLSAAVASVAPRPPRALGRAAVLARNGT